jgi:GTP-binding protein
MKPIVAIVGRPNVGKSTLFNRISRERRSLVDDMPGVTRDRLYSDVVWNGRPFLLIDTGGFEPSTAEPLLAQMRHQTQLAIEEADVVVFLLDAIEGLTASDRETAELLRRTSKPVFHAVNKVDGARHDALAMEFYELGADRLHPISAKHGRGVFEFLDALTRDFPEGDGNVPETEGGIRVAVVGRPNVGKSSLVNRLCGRERALVSPIPGTTRDAVDTEVRWHGKPFLLIDTAGIRRKSQTRLPLEKYSVIKALKSLERCDVALLLLDAVEGATDQDGSIGGYVVERGRGCILLANKWDLVEKDHRTHDETVRRIREQLPHLEFAPVLTMSALTGLRVGRLLAWVERVHEACGRRIPTPLLNERFAAWLEEHPPPLHKRRRVKLYYATQPRVYPPTFVVFSNMPEGFSESYRRYLVRRIREEFDFLGATVRLHVRPRGGKPERR